MKIAEISLSIRADGSMLIPTDLIREMGLQAGDTIRVSYLTPDGVTNSYRELLIYAEGSKAENDFDSRSIQIPTELLQQAQIHQEADMQIICLDGALLICRDNEANVDELYGVLEHLRTCGELVSALSSDPEELRNQLSDLIERYSEGMVDENERNSSTGAGGTENA